MDLHRSVPVFARNGNSDIIAGKKVIERIKQQQHPWQQSYLDCLNGGASEKFMLRKPIHVVRLARNTG